VKLIYVTVSMPFGPGEEFIIEEAKEWMRRDCEITIVPRSPVGGITNNDAQCLGPVSIWNRSWWPEVLVSAICQALCHPFRLAKILRLLAGSRDGMTLWKNLLVLPKGLWLGRLAKRRKADHIHAHWASTSGTMALIAGEWSGIPWSLTAHRGDVASNNLLALKSVKASFIRYISEMTLKMAAELGADVAPERAVVIHMGVILPVPSDVASRDNTPPVLLCPADLYPVKGHEHLLRAMAILKQKGVACTLRLAGEGHLQETLQRLAQQLALGPMVEFLGRVPHDRLLDWYRRREIDLVILPSVDLGNHLHEGIPVSLMEAMAQGVAVVSTTTGGIPELLRDGAGVLVPPQDPAALAEAIERLIGDRESREQLAAAGRRRIEEQFSVEHAVTKLAARIEHEHPAD
jgi:colanic acid/amylovoran biosynthesis glycosyltransferase